MQLSRKNRTASVRHQRIRSSSKLLAMGRTASIPKWLANRPCVIASMLYLNSGERVLYVKAADGLDYSAVAAAIDTAPAVQIDRVALMPR